MSLETRLRENFAWSNACAKRNSGCSSIYRCCRGNTSNYVTTPPHHKIEGKPRGEKICFLYSNTHTQIVLPTGGRLKIYLCYSGNLQIDKNFVDLLPCAHMCSRVMCLVASVCVRICICAYMYIYTYRISSNSIRGYY